MADTGPGSDRPRTAPAGWRGRVVFGPPERPVAFKPGQVLVADTDTATSERLVELLNFFPGWERREAGLPGFTLIELATRSTLTTASDGDIARARRQTLRLVDELKAQGLRAQPNHVFFADQRGFEGNPYAGNPYAGNPYAGNPYAGNPYAGNPYAGNPYAGNPYAGNPLVTGWPSEVHQPTGIRPSSAQPRLRHDSAVVVDDWPRVLVLDTGLPEDPARHLPGLDLQGIAGLTGVNPQPKDRGGQVIDLSDLLVDDDAHPDRWDMHDTTQDQDARLDPAAGHGAFIAEVIGRIAPRVSVTVVRVLGQLGDGDELKVARVLDRLAGQYDLVNLSFGTYTAEQAWVTADAVRTVQRGGPLGGPSESHPAVVVASAGNDGTWVAPLPASLPEVVSVAALDWHEQGPAQFSNFGPWVSACAPGADVRQDFWVWPGGERLWPGSATWSGTSFAAPYVVGALAQTMRVMRHAQNGATIDPNDAVERLLRAPDLLRIPMHGTVVRV